MDNSHRSPHPDVLAFTAAVRPKSQWIIVREVVEQVCGQLRPRIAEAGVEVELDVPRGLVLWADRQMLRTAIANLAVNALEAMPGGGRLEITLCQGRAGLELEVADSGPGLSAQSLRHAFDPSFTTKPHAAGMGLAVVRTIAQAHGGDVVAANCPEGGAAFTLRFPRQASQAAA